MILTTYRKLVKSMLGATDETAQDTDDVSLLFYWEGNLSSKFLK
jgi:hypothetical protein